MSSSMDIPAQSKQANDGPILAFVLLLALAVIWSSAFAAIKIGVSSMPPMTLAALRIMLAAFILCLAVKWRGESLSLPRRYWAVFFGMGLFGNSLPFFLIGWGEAVVSSGLASILMAVMPLVTVALAHWVTDDEKLTRRRSAGIVLGLAGVVFLVGVDALQGLGNQVVRQTAVAGGAVCYALAAILARRLVADISTIKRAALTMVFAAVQAGLLALILEQPWQMNAEPEAWGAVVYLGLFPTALAALIYFHLIKIRGATFVSIINYIIPVFGVLWGWWFLDEVLSGGAFVALALILLGIWLTTRRAGWGIR